MGKFFSKNGTQEEFFYSASQHSISSVDLGLQHFAALRSFLFFIKFYKAAKKENNLYYG
jgi:hypothetical protein